MDSLNDDVLAIIIEMEPQLGLACRRFWNILEYHSRLKALRCLGSRRMADELRADCQSLLGLSSWGVTAYLARFDLWFFSPQHVVGLQDGDISDAPSPDDERELAQGVWRTVHGLKWGTSLHASNVRWLHLQYQTKLRPGRYKICINLRVDNFVDLYTIKFECLSPYAKQLGSIYPTVHLDTNNNHPDCIFEYNQYLQFRSCELCIGLVDVGRIPNSNQWPLLTFNIVDDAPTYNKGLLLNYLYFERVDANTPPNDFWALNRKRFWPTKEWVTLFERNSHRKFLQ